MEQDYERGIMRLMAKIVRMRPRVLVAYDYTTDTRFTALKSMAKNSYKSQDKYFAFSEAAHQAYIAARNNFLDAEHTYLRASEPFRVLAAISRKRCSHIDQKPITPAYF